MSDVIDVDRLSQELVHAVRGERTQQQLSSDLGFGSNVIYMWESGRRAPEVSRFLRMAETCGAPSPVASFFSEASPALQRARLSTPRGVQRLVLELVGSAKKSHLAERLGVDRSTLARWLDAKTEPRLPDLLRLVHITTQRLLAFVECFADPGTLPSTRDVWRDLEAQQRLAYDAPWSHAVLRALELCGYRRLPRHCDDYVARELGISAEQAASYVSELAAAGQISWDGTHYELSRVLTVDTRKDRSGDLRLKEHWGRVSVERLAEQAAPSDALFSYNLFAVSSEKLEKIRQLHLEYYDAVRALVDESASADQVVLMNLHLLPLGS